jgi:hypothetical protein
MFLLIVVTHLDIGLLGHVLLAIVTPRRPEIPSQERIHLARQALGLHILLGSSNSRVKLQT